MKTAVRMLFTLCMYGAVVFAQTAVPPGGSGTGADPYRIASLENLYWLSQTSSAWNAYCVQTADIDAAATSTWSGGLGFPPIGSNAARFTGTYNGRGYMISNLFISRSSQDYVGLFGYIGAGGRVNSLRISEVRILGREYSGGLAGYNLGTIDSCSTAGVVNGSNQVGGLVGENNVGTISMSSSTATVSGLNNVAGLVGQNAGNATISYCYATGNVNGGSDSVANYTAGGLVGWNNSSTIRNCYATGNVCGAMPVGSLVGGGTGDFLYCYAMNDVRVAADSSLYDAFIGDMRGVTITSSYFNSNGHGWYDAWTDERMNSADMKQRQTYINAGWDFAGETGNGTVDKWVMVPWYNNGFPCLLGYDGIEPSGDGSTGNPYRIGTLENLYWLSQSSGYWDCSFIQTADINADSSRSWDEGRGFPPIGNAEVNFSGTYNGDGHSITHVHIADASLDTLGLFRIAASTACIDSLRVEIDTLLGRNFVGGLVGMNHGTIRSCSTTGIVLGTDYVGGLAGENTGGTIQTSSSAATVNASSMVGGLVGENNGGTISMSHSTGTVTGLNNVAGFAGQNVGGGTISYCYATGNVSGGSVSGVNYTAGGLIGWNEGSIVSNCYATGNVCGARPIGSCVGGGDGSFEYCYAINDVRIAADSSLYYDFMGEFRGGSMTNCYYNSNSDGWYDAWTGEGMSGADMTRRQTYINAGWDFAGETENGTLDRWVIIPWYNNGLPCFHTYDEIKPPGEGTTGTPYRIGSLKHLYWLSQNPAYWDCSYVQTADINADSSRLWEGGLGFTPIGNNSFNFAGTYEGNGHSITHLFIADTSMDYAGLFGLAAPAACIDSLGVGIDTLLGRSYVGGLVGMNYGQIQSCYTTGVVLGTNQVAGLVGENAGGTILMSYSTAAVRAENNVAGLVGQNSGGGIIRYSYAAGDIHGGSVAGVNYTSGGLIGWIEGGNVSNCYVKGDVCGAMPVGGLIGGGFGVFEYCYAMNNVRVAADSSLYYAFIGEFRGGTMTSCYYNSNSDGWYDAWTDSSISSADMQRKSFIVAAGWDSTMWSLDGVTNNGYPFLSWQQTGETPLPVELASFTAAASATNAVLKWTTASEVNCARFEIERRLVPEPANAAGSPAVQTALSTSEWRNIGFVNVAGSSNTVKSYSFTDKGLAAGRYAYRLKQVDNDGTHGYSLAVEVSIAAPKVFALYRNYPNPFNPSTTIQYDIPEGRLCHVSLKVYDLVGREVATLVNEQKTPGMYTVVFNAARLSSGVYFYRLVAGNFTAVKKLVLLK